MGKTTVTFSIDIEAAGPIPGPSWMCSFGICRTDDVTVGLKKELRPLVIPDIPSDRLKVLTRIIIPSYHSNHLQYTP